MVPYFKAGLENNEFCMWITSEPLKVEDAKAALKKAVKNLDHFINKGQIEILDYSEWYTKSGKFDANNVLQGWVEKENQALKRGYDGLRLSENTFGLAERDWRNFTDYEEEVNNVIGKYRMMAICTYSLGQCGASEVIDVMSNHQFALMRREGQWVIIENSERKRAQAKLNETNTRLQILQQITASVHSTLNLEEVLRQITDGFVFSMGFTSSFIMKLNDQKTHFEVKAFSTKQWILDKVDKILGFSLRNYSLPVNPELNDTVRAVRKGEIVVAKTAAEIAYPLISKETCSVLQKLGGIQNYIVVPLRVDKEVVGGVIITSTQQEVSEEELKMVKIFSQAASHAIQNANLHKQTRQAEETLRESEDRYRDLVEHSHDLICTHDLEGRILSFNQWALETLGYDKNDKEVHLKKNIRDILAPKFREEFDTYLDTIKRDGVAKGVMLVQTAKGEKRLWEYHNTLRTEGVNVPIVRAMAHDVTERRRAEAERERLLANLEAKNRELEAFV